MPKPLWVQSSVACCKRRPLWALSFAGCAVLTVGGVCWLAKRGGPASAQAAPAAQKQVIAPALVWNVATGEGLPTPTPSHSISLGNNTTAPAWGPGRVTVQLPGGRTLDYSPEALSTFEVTDVGREVRLRFPKQPLAAAQARARALLTDWRLINEPAYLDRWYAKRSDPANRAPSTVWVSTMGSRVPAIVTLAQPSREQDQWVVTLQVFPKHVREK